MRILFAALAALLLSVSLANAQGQQCRTAPPGTSTPNCASEAFVTSSVTTTTDDSNSSAWPPGPKCPVDMNYLMTPEPYASGDQHNGFVIGWSYAKHCWMVEPPKLLSGPGNLPNVPSSCGGIDEGGICLTQNAFVFLDDGIDSGGFGFRAGAQYPPAGVDIIIGVFDVLTTNANSSIEIEATIGTQFGAAGSHQENMLVGSPVIVGGGNQNCPTAGKHCQIVVLVAKVQCAPGLSGMYPGYGNACEIRFAARTTNVGDVMQTKTPNLPINIVSSNTLVRTGGVDFIQ